MYDLSLTTFFGGSSTPAFFRGSITIDHTKVPNTDQTNFPVLVSGTYSFFKTVANGGMVQNANGFDIEFYSDAGLTTKLKWETEKYSATTGNVDYWVKIPTVSHTVDTVFYFRYGDASIVTDQSDPTAVWDSNFKGVYHLPNGTTLTSLDSTTNNNDLTPINTPTAITGKIDGGVHFVNALIQYLENPSTNFGLTNNEFTISVWMNSQSSADQRIVLGVGSSAGADNAIHIKQETNTTLRFAMFADDLDVTVPALDAAGWIYVVATLNSAKLMEITVNGTSLGTRTANNMFLGDDLFRIGSLGYTTDNSWDGYEDEVRVSVNIVRTNDWIKTEYNNQNSPSTFYAISAPI